jgi:hypothetical protein
MGSPRLIPVLLCALLLPALPSAAEDAAAGLSGRYLVFEVGEDGGVRPQMHRFVRFGSERRSLTPEETAARLAAPSRDEERIRVRMFDAGGGLAFEDVVRVPRWTRAEAADTESRIPLSGKRAFVVRVPAVERSWLALSVGREGGAPKETAFRDAEFDLDALAADASLPLARFAPPVELRKSPEANSGNRIDLLVMGDGYTSAESVKFNSDSANVINNFFGIPPYSTYRNFFNTATLFTPSPQSGADHPPYDAACAPSFRQQCCADPLAQTDPKAGTFVDTAYDATYCSQNTHRALVLDSAKVLAAAAATPDWDLILVVANDTTHGATGGVVAIISTHPSSVNSAQHELGHSFALLADEYDLAYPGYPACSDVTAPSCEPNVTDRTDRASIKWNDWIAGSTPVPTPATQQYNTLVGLFQGARYMTSGFYRPRQNCLMRALGQPFCEICKQEFVLRFYEGGWGVPAAGVDLIEPGTESPAPGFVSIPFPGSQTFTVGLLKPTGGALTTTWSVDGAAVPGATGNTFTYTPSTEGSHQIEVKTTDTTGFVRDAAGHGVSLESNRHWTAGVGQGGRFGIEVDWAVPSQGRTGVGTEVSLTPDTRYFWFFTPANIELVIKVLDGRAINGKYWVFYGALSSVQYTIRITDSATGAVKTYTNPAGTLASIADVNAFEGAAPAPGVRVPREDELSWALAAQARAGFAPGAPTISSLPAVASPGASPSCTPSARNLCLNASRFQLQVDWEVPSQGRSGTGTAIPITTDTGYFWFFTSANVELVIKVLDGRAINDHYWVFYGALSSVQYTIRITDTVTGATKTYTNPSGTLASVADTSAF